MQDGEPYPVASSLTAGSSRFYTVSVKLDPDADNTFQGRKADVSLELEGSAVGPSTALA